MRCWGGAPLRGSGSFQGRKRGQRSHSAHHVRAHSSHYTSVCSKVTREVQEKSVLTFLSDDAGWAASHAETGRAFSLGSRWKKAPLQPPEASPEENTSLHFPTLRSLKAQQQEVHMATPGGQMPSLLVNRPIPSHPLCSNCQSGQFPQELSSDC